MELHHNLGMLVMFIRHDMFRLQPNVAAMVGNNIDINNPNIPLQMLEYNEPKRIFYHMHPPIVNNFCNIQS